MNAKTDKIPTAVECLTAIGAACAIGRAVLKSVTKKPTFFCYIKIV